MLRIVLNQPELIFSSGKLKVIFFVLIGRNVHVQGQKHVLKLVSQISVLHMPLALRR